MALIGIAGRQRDLGERHLAFQDQGLRAADAASFDKAYRRHARALLEKAGEVEPTDIDDPGQLGKTDHPVDIVRYPADLPGSKARQVVRRRRVALLGGPGNLMISSVIINQFGAAFDWPLGSALAVIVIAVVGLGVLGFGLLEKRHG